MAAKNIDEVIEQLESIISYCISQNNRAGYFAALYHRVTCRIKEGILNNEFEDCERMERLDVLFANYYITAWEQWNAGKPLSASWKIAFEAAQQKGIVMQHLLLGINAHINLDLGVATVDTMKGFPLDGIRKDFDMINTVLATLVDTVKQEIFKVSLMMKLLDRIGGKYDEMLVNFSINTARDGAWRFAQELATKEGAPYQSCVETRDTAIADLGQRLAKPGSRLFSFWVKFIGWFEWKSPSVIIETLQYVAKKGADKTKPVFAKKVEVSTS